MFFNNDKTMRTARKALLEFAIAAIMVAASMFLSPTYIFWPASIAEKVRTYMNVYSDVMRRHSRLWKSKSSS